VFGKSADKIQHVPETRAKPAEFLENNMSNTGIRRRETSKVRRAQASFVPANQLPVARVNESVVRHARVAAMKEKISSVDFDLDTDFRKAMHKLLEDFGA
jgi:anti-sigma28 factor (negative regulator of flagellin synthesis)